MRLYEVAVEGLELERILEESGGELDEETEKRFDALLAGGKHVINAACCVRRNLLADAEACKAEATRLFERARGYARQVESLESRILAAVVCGFSNPAKPGEGKLKTDIFTVWSQTSPPTKEYTLAADVDINVLAEEEPDLVRTTRELNKTQCKELEKAESLPTSIVSTPKPGTQYLRIT
jgi:Siphovirus Gp157